jgi:hypothetical protein
MKVSLSLAVLTVISFATCLARAAELPAEPGVWWIQFNTSSTSWRFDLLPVLLLCLCVGVLLFFFGLCFGLDIESNRKEREITESRWEMEQMQGQLQQLQQQLDVAMQQRDHAASQSQRSLSLLREFERRLSEYLAASDKSNRKLRLDQSGSLQEINNGQSV